MCMEIRIYDRRVIHGPNFIEVEVKSYLKLLVEEVLNPFYVFQILSVALWCFDEYVYYATCVVIISAISIAIALVETKRQSKMLRDMAQSSEMGKITIRTPNGGNQNQNGHTLSHFHSLEIYISYILILCLCF